MTQSEQEQWIRIFDVPETRLHHDGYTIYRIVSTLLHRSFPEASTSVEVWRRYSAILRLHKEIIKLCNHLQISESPPAYSKPSMINRFDYEIIESRRKCTLLLLSYCAKYPSVYSSEQFTSFFKEDFNMKKKRLSFSRLKEKKSSSSLASSLGLAESGLSLYAHLDQNTSSSEDLSSRATHEENVEDFTHMSPQAPSGACEPPGREGSEASLSNSTLQKVCRETRASDVLLPSITHSAAVRNKKTGLQNIQENFSPTHLPLSCREIYASPSVGEEPIFVRKVKDDSSLNTKLHPSHGLTEGSFLPKKAVRTKTTQYLQKAEQLIARFSLRETKQGQINSQSCHDARKEKSLRSASSYMKNYQVVGISGKIITAIDIITLETVAIKVIGKGTEERSKKLVLPLSVPFMVPLIRFHETDFAFYLVLKYVSGGKLWNHLKKFIKQPSSSTSYPNRGNKSSCTYEGQRLIFESDECSEKEILMNVQSNQEFDISETDQRSLSFGTDLAVAECRSSAEIYSIPYAVDRGRYQTSLSNIIDFPHDRDTERLSIDRLSVPSYSQIGQASPQTKSKSLDDVNSSGEDAFEPKGFSVEVNNLWKGRNGENLNIGDSHSIGSDTLSGVSDDFSCSSFNPVPQVENPEHHSNGRAESTSIAPPLSSSFVSANETSRSGTFDVNSLIKNSKKLIEDVNRTLEQSKRQIIRTFSSSRESASQPLQAPVPPMERKRKPINTSTKCIPLEKNEHAAHSCTHSIPLDAYAHMNELNDCHAEPSPKEDSDNLLAVLSNFSEDSSPLSKSRFGNKISLPNESLDKDMLESNSKDLRCPSPSLIPPTLVSMSSLIENYSSTLVEGNQQIPEGLVRVWVSQVISAMDHLHHQEIVWGDFNPSNILLDEGGSILVTYRSFYGNPKLFVGSSFRTKDDTGFDWLSSLGYLSPELFNPVSFATRLSDWWSVGALLFHLLIGKDLASCHPSGITSHMQINFARPVTEEAASLISNLLCVHPMERLGSSSTGVQEIKDHPFFFGITWPE